MYECIDDPDWKNLYFVLEFVAGGSLLSLTSRKKELSMDKLRSYFRDMLLAIEYVHEIANIIHRDIKPENILISGDDRLKLTDFGLSKMIEGEDLIQKTAGSNFYFSPEACKGKNY